MSINVSSVNNTTSYTTDKTVNSVPAATADETITRIHSVDALQKAERSGEKVSAGEEQVVKNIERALKAIQGPDTMLEMSVHKETNTIIVKVKNKDTGELIREIPPEKTLDLVAKFMEINGILIDEKI